MKRIALFLLVSIAGFTYGATLDIKHLAIGAFLGSPTGLSLGYFANNANVINFVVGWNFERNPSLIITGDYTYRWDITSSPGKLFLYAGLGGLVKIAGSVDLGLRIPLGIAFFTPEIPLELFFELGPGMRLLPATEPFLNGGVGIRWRL